MSIKYGVRESEYNIAQNGLIVLLDPAIQDSYPLSGTTMYDISGLGGTAVINGTTTFQGLSFNFDGSDDYIRYTRSDINAYSFSYPTASFEMWINPNPSATGDNNIITIENCFEIRVVNNGNGTCRISYASNPWAWIDTGIDLPIGEWVHVVYAHSEVAGRWVYIDGVQKFYTATAGGLAAGRVEYQYMTLGGRYSGTSSSFIGNISRISIYNKVLSQKEITYNFNMIRGRFGI